MSIIWTIIIGFVAGIIAKLIYPGNKYEPTGFIWTTVLGIIGAFVATYLGQAVGWYQPGEGAGFIGAIVGAIIILTVWGFIAPRFEQWNVAKAKWTEKKTQWNDCQTQATAKNLSGRKSWQFLYDCMTK